jgi:hypothetical protein
MFNKVIEKFTGKDDVERVAETGDLQRLNDCLKTRRLLFPKKPMRFLDAATFTQEESLELIGSRVRARAPACGRCRGGPVGRAWRVG